MEIIIKARNAEIHPNFRSYCEEKLAKVEQFYPHVQRVDVELTHTDKGNMADTAERIELTVYGKGPIIRAEASSSDRHASLDIACGKLYERLRRAHNRAIDRRRTKSNKGAHEIIDIEHLDLTDALPVQTVEEPKDNIDCPHIEKVGEEKAIQLGDSPVIVKQKLYEAEAMSISQALYQMELIGHPFFMFIDSESKQPCVVYRRHGWTYGVIRLDTTVS